MKLLFRIVLLIALCVLTGCATIFSGSAPQVVSIVTEPEGVDVAVINMRSADTILKVKGPFTAVLERKDGSFQPSSYWVMLTKPGYIEEDIEIPSAMAGWVLGNVILGGPLGVVIDGASGAMFALDDTPIKMTLFPDTLEGRILSLEQRKRLASDWREYY